VYVDDVGFGNLSAPNAYDSWDGTSMAAPDVTGAVALCAAQFPSETMAQRGQRILGQVDPIASLSAKMTTGGRLNVAAAVNLDTGRPQVIQLASPTHPDPARSYSNRNPVVSWSAVIDSAAATSAFKGVQDGRWFFHVRARDVAGNWGETRSVPVRIGTLGPRTLAKGSIRGKRGTWATLPYAVSDNLSAKMKVTIVVRHSVASLRR
jgi:subtilisin family serine protease